MSTAAPASSSPTPSTPGRVPAPTAPPPAPLRLGAKPALSPIAARGVAMGLLVALCLAHTTALIDPPSWGAGLLAAASCALCASALVASGRLTGTSRTIAACAAAVLLGALVALAAGVAAGDLRPARLGHTLGALGRAVAALPTVHVPYAGSDVWVRRAVQLSADAALAAATALVFWPGPGRRPDALGTSRRVLAAGLVVVVYAAAEVNLRGNAQAGRGVLLFAGLAALLWLERLGRAVAGPAALVVGLAALAGLGAAPVLQHRPLVDVGSATRTLSGATGEGFDWDQRYGPLSWPRDGRTVLEVRSPRPDYWKAVALERFNGTAWVQDSGHTAARPDPGLPDAATQRRSTRTITVTLGSLRSAEFIGAGTTTRITGASLQPVAGTSPGTFRTATGALGVGQAYAATVYTPHLDAVRGQPVRGQTGSTTSYPEGLAGDLELTLPAPGRPLSIRFPAFGQNGVPVLAATGAPATSALAASPYAGAWRLARALAARARSPAGLVLAVQSALGPGFRYSEHAPEHRYPLQAFLFGDRRGSCQHFSGAMALLLRMAGIPARVAAGFTPGRYEARRGLWTVSDFEAHAWVEAYFPGVGWTTFDPTPSSAPARGGHGAGAPRLAGHRRPRSAVRRRPGVAAVPAPPPPTSHSAGTHGHSGLPAWALAALGSLVAGLLAAGAARVRLARRWVTDPGATGVGEIAGALGACGLGGRGLTCEQLAARLGATPAGNYLRALSQLRFAPTQGSMRLDPAGRRALRQSLARGGSLRQRLGLLIALPPGAGPRANRRGAA